ncbi:MAG: alpha/beta hydrolase [Myxococcales bacterium]|nr:alpha/beta hydrolase [Myxococcales bacterium]
MIPINRRNLLLSSGSLSLTACARTVPKSQSTSTSTSLLVDLDREPDETIAIWPNQPPGLPSTALSEKVVERTNPWGLRDRAALEVATPTLSLFRSPKPDGSAMIIMPGGGYRLVVIDKEGFEGARLFSRHHTTVYVLRYRLPHQGWSAGPDTPLQDAQRAIRVIRARSATDGIDPERIMVMGFSAGGHLVGSLCQRYDDLVYRPTDKIDHQSARPNLGAMIYPVTLMEGPHIHTGSRNHLLGEEPQPHLIEKYDITRHPNPAGPPIFILHSLDDESVPLENALTFALKAREASVPTSMHIFAAGGHGFGLRGINDLPVGVWPKLIRDWAKAHHFYRG